MTQINGRYVYGVDRAKMPRQCMRCGRVRVHSWGSDVCVRCAWRGATGKRNQKPARR